MISPCCLCVRVSVVTIQRIGNKFTEPYAVCVHRNKILIPARDELS
jgi:hypothetical protein